MYSDARGARTLYAADFHDQRRGQLGVLLVFLVVLDHPELVADVLGRPVTLLACLTCRAQVVQRSRYRSRIQVECDGDHLPGAIEL